MVAGSTLFWKKIPFLKLLLALVTGILLQWHGQLKAGIWWCGLLSSLAMIFLLSFLPAFKRYKISFIIGIFICLLSFCAGALLTIHKDIRNNKEWLGNFYKPGDAVMMTIDEPPVEKARSVKANASVSYLVQDGQQRPVTGKVIIYFSKDSLLTIDHGSQLLLKKPLQPIKNSGNPGGFDYKRYCLFQGITQQVYLKPGEFEILPGRKENAFQSFLFATRQWVLNVLRTYISDEKALGLSEALLIGYKDDLEQSLVQSYTNTGVVHIIAISGLHLGLIYWLMSLICSPLKKKKQTKWLVPVILITGLWLFSLLAGAQPSILRSAVMFTCIVLGESFSRRTSIYNTMAVSAFILLCIHPYWLWDVGFQLSYAAVLSIIIFMRPIHNWFYIKNKVLDFTWKLNAVTLAAQILTIPVSIYHFHQFPSLFFLSNFLAVPLSSLILIGEIFLCVISFAPSLAVMVGKAVTWSIQLMNSYIERVEAIRFSLWDGLYINMTQALLLLLFTAGISKWLMERAVAGLKLGLLSLLGFAALRSVSFIESQHQQKIIVYNVPQKTAIDFIDGREYQFFGNKELTSDDFSRNFHLKPARILHRVKEADTLSHLSSSGNYIRFKGRSVLLVDSSILLKPAAQKPTIDLLIISKKPRLYIKKVAAAFNIRQVVFDGSVPAWKSTYWKKDCDSLKIPWHDVLTSGAFMMDME